MFEHNEERWIGIDEAAEYLGVNKDSIRNWIKKKKEFPLTKLASNGNLRRMNWMSGLKAGKVQ